MNKSTQSTLKPYYFSIDVLRGLTALLICIYHFINHQDANGTLFSTENIIKKSSFIVTDVVFIFFLISGFIIPLSMYRQNFKFKKAHLFLARRWVRIEIPYIVSIFVMLGISFTWSIKQGSTFEIDSWRFLHHLTYTTTLFDYKWFNEIYWTLAIEFQFYILIGFIFPLIVSKNSFLKYLTLLIFGLSGLIIDDNRLVFQYAPIFVVGMLFFLFKLEKKYKSINLFLISSFLLLSIYTHGILVCMFLLISLIVIEFMSDSFRLLNKLGKVAYSFYLMHGPIGGSLIYFLAKGIESSLLKLVIVIFALGTSIFLSYFFYILIEKPSHILSKKINFSEKN